MEIVSSWLELSKNSASLVVALSVEENYGKLSGYLYELAIEVVF